MASTGNFDEVDDLCVKTIRVLAADTVEKAKSGHPGAPIGLAAVAHVLFSRFIKGNPKDSKWINRDRFVLSNGHACALQYVMLHFCGYDVQMDDLKNFRQVNSRTPGHPENFLTDGIEVSTGPLGQGIAQAVGLALAQKHLAAVNNKPDLDVFNSKIYVLCGDGCMQEGVASEAASLAAHWRLNNLILLYDDNTIQIDGHTDLAFTEDVSARFRAYGWNTAVVADGNEDLNAIAAAIADAQNSDKPTLISIKTVIGYKTTKADTHGVHGSPLGGESLAAFKQEMGFNPEETFVVDQRVYDRYAQTFGARGEQSQAEWTALFEQYKTAFAEDGARLDRQIAGVLPDGWQDALPVYDENSKKQATRNLSGEVLNALVNVIPEIVGGAADLTPSTKTQLKSSHDFQDATPDGRYIRFGVREFAMFAICNGISAFGILVPFSATFLNFITYGWGAVRLGALSHLRQIYVMTHDSIFLGEDGPTHQPVEVLPLLRATPNLLCIRPADGNEVAGAYEVGMEFHGPTVICLSRQGVTPLSTTSRDGVKQGAYVLSDGDDAKDGFDVCLISTGSEVQIIVEAATILRGEGMKVRVISAPCLELFGTEENAEYRKTVLPEGVPVVAVEASIALGWQLYSHYQIGMTSFGLSGPGGAVADFFGITGPKVAESTKAFLASNSLKGDTNYYPRLPGVW